MLRRMNRKYTPRAVRRKARTVSALSSGLGDHDRYHRRVPGRDRRRFRGNARVALPTRCLPMRSRSSIPSGAARRPRTGSKCQARCPRARFARLLDAQNAATRAYHDRKIGTTRPRADPRSLEKRSRETRRQNARQRDRDRPYAAGLRRDALRARAVARYRDRDARTCGAAPARSSRRAARFDDVGTAVAAPVIDLVSGLARLA